jgi:hypothetical protein
MAASPKVYEANRRNARKSTGPCTPAGKARSRANGVRHGAYCAVVVPGHQQDLYLLRLGAWANADAPDDAEREADALDQAVRASLRRDALDELRGRRVHKRRARAEREFDEKLEEALEAAVSLLAERPEEAVTKLEGQGLGCTFLAGEWAEVIEALGVWDGAAPLPAEAVDRISRLMGLPRDPADGRLATFLAEYSGVVAQEDRQELLALAEGARRDLDERAAKLLAEEASERAYKLAVATADATRKGRELEQLHARAGRQVSQGFAMLDKLRAERRTEARALERRAGTPTSFLGHIAEMQGVADRYLAARGAGPKTGSEPDSSAQVVKDKGEATSRKHAGSAPAGPAKPAVEGQGDRASAPSESVPSGAAAKTGSEPDSSAQVTKDQAPVACDDEAEPAPSKVFPWLKHPIKIAAPALYAECLDVHEELKRAARIAKSPPDGPQRRDEDERRRRRKQEKRARRRGHC